ncbi:MAG: ribonuclease J [Hyphomicrobium sp.]|uniref:ribonuclease J n=1 Tax=Hyphomicrobium sp. TaxID=82 RepID=UPI001324B4A1|nr:ribonuclease J [Hyphomicrobium sp.]KAB2941092.1 MAG: ribonuclease J [Hyphomicrobium sp.]MBZ0210987.1 ribonuclease J [Hyphomicrobium sp.]
MNEKKRATRRGTGGDELVFLALGGLGEIGMNAYLYGFGPEDRRRWLMVDCGITFPEGEFDPGIDVILPDVRFIEENRADLAGIVITHAHEDHIGAVIELWPRLKVPVYATPFTAGMLKSKLAEHGNGLQIPIDVIALDSQFNVGPFSIELFSLAHSIPEMSALAIRTPLGTVFHTGDWKLDATPTIGTPLNVARMQKLGDEGVLALVIDSTNAFREGISPSELDVARSLTEIVKDAPRRVAVTTFSSNVARVKAVAEAARAAGRQLVVAGRALHRVIEVAVDTGYLPQGFRYLDQDQFTYLDRKDVVLLCTGSQGEARAALARIAEEEHPDVSLDKGDLVIFSSRTIPGNEKAVGRIQNNLARNGCEILTDNEALVHVSGHPRRDELRQMYRWMRPKIAVPMHGEARHIKAQAELARDMGVSTVFPLTDGEILRLAPDPAVIDDAPVGRLFRDGRLLVTEAEGPVRERRKLSIVGVVAVSLCLSRKGAVLADPQAVIDGVPGENAEGEAMVDIVLDAVDGTLRSIPQQNRKNPELVGEAVRRAVRAAVNEAWGKKPICKVFVNVVDSK